MKELIKKLLREALVDELSLKGKDFFGGGIEHVLFTSKKNPNILYKIGPEETINKWTKIFMSNPKLFPKVFKVSKLNNPKYPAEYYYATIEKLNTERVEHEWHQMDIGFAGIPFEPDEDEWADPDPSEVFIECLSFKGMFEKQYLKLKNNPKAQELFKKWMIFISKVTEYVEANGLNGLDIHRGNFAYDSKGNMKCIDI